MSKSFRKSQRQLILSQDVDYFLQEMTPTSTVRAGSPKSASQIDKTMTNMDPDKIFETKTIDEVKDLVRKLQYETDCKREELRSLVGERYRDLMDAAETIICMRDTSNEVLTRIQETQTSMANLNTQLSSFRKKFNDNEPDADTLINDDENQYALAAQIKLLMDIPERIWTSVEAGEFVTATKLYLFARHIHTNLSFNHEENLGKI